MDGQEIQKLIDLQNAHMRELRACLDDMQERVTVIEIILAEHAVNPDELEEEFDSKELLKEMHAAAKRARAKVELRHAAKRKNGLPPNPPGSEN